MNKENNCRCVVCLVEQSLLNSLSTQTARTHFQALASKYPVLNHFDSPADVIARLHEHEQVEAANHNAWSGILRALINSIADETAEEIGQQLLLVAYAPAIHKVYREVCQKFPRQCPEDVAQQAALCLLETARSPEMQNLNGHLPAALARRLRQSLFRWAIAETRQSLRLQEVSENTPEPQATTFEECVVLEHLLSKAQRMGILTTTECELVRKFHCEGFQLEELRDTRADPSAIALYRRIQRAVHRLRRIGVAGQGMGGRGIGNQVSPSLLPTSNQPRKISRNAVDSSGEMCIRKSEKGCTPEPAHDVRQFEPDITQLRA